MYHSAKAGARGTRASVALCLALCGGASLAQRADQDPMMTVMTTGGTAGTIPVWTGSADIENTSSTQPGTVGGNLFVAGPNSWVDISAVGGKDDALLNTATTSTSAGVTTLTLSTGTGLPTFNSSTDSGKTIAIAGGGFSGTPTTPTIAATCSPNGGLKLSTTYYVEVTLVKENSSNKFLTESLPTAENGGVTTPSSCSSGQSPRVLISSPSSSTGATAFAVYASTAMGAERQQALSNNTVLTNPAVCNNMNLAASGYNACPIGNSVSLNKIFPEGPQAPTVSTWQTTLNTFPGSSCTGKAAPKPLSPTRCSTT